MHETSLRLCIVINPAFGLRTCYKGQYEYLRARGYDITAIAGEDKDEHEAVRRMGVQTIAVPMERYARPVKDLRSLLELVRIFRTRRFDVIQVSTPKASVLGILAARIAGQRRIVYLVRGRPYECMSGLKRWFYAKLDALCCRLAQVVVPVSASLRTALVSEGLCPPGKVRLVAGGTSRGVDCSSFEPSADRIRAAAAIRASLGISRDEILVLFVGWVRREKGVTELIEAVSIARRTRRDIQLLVLGNEHEPDAIPEPARETLRGGEGFHWRAWAADTSPYYLAADIVVLPSWREGFPRVVLEAAAAERPVITTDVTGCRDSVVHGETGLIVRVRDPGALVAGILALAGDSAIRKAMGRQAGERARRLYSQELVWRGFEELLREVALGPVRDANVEPRT